MDFLSSGDCFDAFKTITRGFFWNYYPDQEIAPTGQLTKMGRAGGGSPLILAYNRELGERGAEAP